MFKDEVRYEAWDEIRQSDLAAFKKLLPDSVFEEAGRRAGVKEQQCPLCGVNLVWLGIVAALQHMSSFAEVLTETLRMLDLTANGLPQPIVKERRNAKRRKSKRSKHDPRGTDPAVISEEAFVQARRRMPQAWWEFLIQVLTERFEAQHGNLIRWKDFRLLSLDGTTLRLPKDQRLSKHFGTSGNGKKRTTQARMVLLQFPLVRLPWRYELSPISQGERTVAERLLKDLKPQDLVLMDRGFWSYGLFHQVQSAGAFFGIRLPAKVKLRTLKRLGPNDRLVEWKMPTSKRWRGSGLPKSITLRVIGYRLPGFRKSSVVTNVLDPERISRDEWTYAATTSEIGRPLDRSVRLRQGLYHRRWEIETTFYELKEVQKMESSLRSHTPESIRYEVGGHIVLYLLIRWLMTEAALSEDLDGDPLGLSFKHAFEELVLTWSGLITAEPSERPRMVCRMLKHIAAHQVPFRPGRHEPRPGDGKTKNLGYGKSRKSHKLKPKRKQAATSRRQQA